MIVCDLQQFGSTGGGIASALVVDSLRNTSSRRVRFTAKCLYSRLRSLGVW